MIKIIKMYNIGSFMGIDCQHWIEHVPSYIYNFDITRYIQSTAMKIFNLLIEIN